MAFLNTLATLAVNIIVNNAQANAQINSVRNNLNGVVKTAAQFYIVRSAMIAAFQGIEMAVQKAAELEQGFINIERVARELKGTGFREELTQMARDLPGVTLEDLQKALKVTAQLGIHAKDELLAFGKIVTELAVITGLSGETIATHLGKIAAVFKIDPKNIEPFVNAVLQLADDMPVTEEEILSITEKLGGFAYEIGLSARETAAFAATMKSIGPSSSESRTALFSLFSKLEAHPGKIAEAFKLTKDQMASIFTLMRQNPAEGIIKFLQLMQGKSPGAMIQALEQLGIKGRNNASAIIALVDNIEKLKKALDDSETGAKENSRLQSQMADNAKGLAAKLKDLKDAWNQFLTSLGNSAGIKSAIDDLTALLNAITKIIEKTEGINWNFSQDFGAELHKMYENWWLHVFGISPDDRKPIKTKPLVPTEEEKKKPVGDIKKDFNHLFEADEKKKKKEKDGEHFKGFMNLEDAWKNKVLDSLDQQQKEFQKLDDIWKENVDQNKNLQAINESIKDINVGMV